MVDVSVYAVTGAVFQILLLGAIGYALFRARLLDCQGIDIITGLVINLFLPAFILHQFMVHFNFAEYPRWWIFPLMSFAVTAVACGMCAIVFARHKPGPEKRGLFSLVMFQNAGYIPLMLVTALFSDSIAGEFYIYIFLFLVGFNLVMWSLGVWLLAGSEQKRPAFKDIINAPLIAVAASLALVWLGAPRIIPPVVQQPLKMLGDCTLPLALIAIGGSLACIKMGPIKKEVVAAVCAKLIVMPVLGLTAVTLLKTSPVIGILIMLQAATPSAVSLSIIARHHKAHDALINQGILLSHLLCILTMPLFFMLYTRILNVV